MPAILVTDDSPTMRRMIIAALTPLPQAYFGEASTGLEAIEQLALRPYDLLILDLNMPDMHGFEVLAFLSNHPRYATLPVLVLTTRGDADSRRMAKEHGATAYMTKPFRPPELLKTVQQLLATSKAVEKGK
ncbi:MAG: response regulator [Anaerolineae bacterium]|nr:response regulator [Anaerolineae bacterium]